MLNLTGIEKYYPENERSFSRNILREYLQYKILEIIFNSEIGRGLSFLGGTALRILYGNNHFSEDLDFDNFGLTEKQFTSLADEVKKGLELQGYKVEIKNVLKGAYRLYIRMPQVLFENDLSNLREEKIMIQINTAPHDFEYRRDLKIINKFDVFTQIYATPPDILLSQKIYAALNRLRAKGRDFFDIVFLLPQTKPSYEYLRAKMGVKNGVELRDVLISKTADFDFNELAKDVEPFLISAGDAKKIKMFVPYIESLEL